MEPVVHKITSSGKSEEVKLSIYLVGKKSLGHFQSSVRSEIVLWPLAVLNLQELFHWPRPVGVVVKHTEPQIRECHVFVIHFFCGWHNKGQDDVWRTINNSWNKPPSCRVGGRMETSGVAAVMSLEICDVFSLILNIFKMQMLKSSRQVVQHAQADSKSLHTSTFCRASPRGVLVLLVFPRLLFISWLLPTYVGVERVYVPALCTC